MVPVRLVLLASLAVATTAACASPEARRSRDGGAGGDPGNKVLRTAELPDPQAADTTLWPGRSPAPVERLAAGEMPPPASITGTASRDTVRGSPVTPNVPVPSSEQRTFDRSKTADPRRPSAPTAPRPR